ncbi:hypothetical protein [Parasediminibacterium sp. JCM 36343]|uniref:hypothetical protein n=1 Tax=Parasediminibacterium sp. JCM 36343 TaxID=3374279 RepID=UPI0039798FDF
MKFVTAFVFIILVAAGISSCKKDSFITSSNAHLSISDDTLHFDTVFTTTGSTTQFFKIFNNNNQKLSLSNVQLMGGSGSFFKLNLDGTAGTSFSNIGIDANDSLYGFVTVSINPNAANLPFIVRDSIKVSYNGNTRYLQLDAYGQNANFLRNTTINKDTTWTSNLPIVILGGVTVSQGATLTLQQGTKVYVNANAPILINGTMQALGDSTGGIRFQSDRIDDPYRDYPGGWPGIYFNEKSINNILRYCTIKNAYQGVIVQSPSSNSSPKLAMVQCIFDNIYDVAIGGSNTSITATNCLVSNCGYNVSLISGGNYSFTHCTMVSYANNYLDHKNPVLTLSNTNSDNSSINPLACTLTNSIVYGSGGLVDDELALVNNTSTGAAFNVTMTNVLYKEKNANNINIAGVTLTNCIANQSPLFDSINTGTRYFDFHFAKGVSPCIDKGINARVKVDLDRHPRPVGLPDIGCYEKQP